MNIGIAVIGCGHWGPNHIRNFSTHKQSTVRYCVDLDAKRLKTVGEQFPSVKMTSDLSQALKDEHVNAVVIATPTATHFKLAKLALEAGKHVLCEKPLAGNSQDAAELGRIAKQAGKLLMVGHVFLFNAGILKLKQLLTAGDVGQLYYLHATRTNLGPIRQDVDCVWDLATHDISIFNFLVGSQPTEVSGRGTHYLQDGKSDVAFMTLTYPGNVLANIHVSWLDPKKIRQITAVGDKKMVTWDDMAAGGPIMIYDKGVVREPDYNDFGEFQLVTKDGDVLVPKVPGREPLRAQADYFIAAIQAGKLGQCGPDEGLGVVRVLEALQTSMQANGAPVKVPA
jgi:predicted dehydrogenase